MDLRLRVPALDVGIHRVLGGGGGAPEGATNLLHFSKHSSAACFSATQMSNVQKGLSPEFLATSHPRADKKKDPHWRFSAYIPVFKKAEKGQKNSAKPWYSRKSGKSFAHNVHDLVCAIVICLSVVHDLPGGVLLACQRGLTQDRHESTLRPHLCTCLSRISTIERDIKMQ